MPEIYVYRVWDLERVRPSQLCPGDLVAMAGPAGSGLFSGNRVTSVRVAGSDRFWRDATYRVEYESPWGPAYFVNPDRMQVYRVTTRREATA